MQNDDIIVLFLARGFENLSHDKKIVYLQSVWDQLAATPKVNPVPA
jgi:hypothetical protein